jgi:hypothetical protein
MKTTPSLILMLFCAVSGQQLLSAATASDDAIWKPFQFMMGDWVGSGSGKPGQGKGEFSLNFDLDHKILIRRNRNQLAPKPGEQAGSIHEDLMIIYPASQEHTFRADYFDNEGHVIHYSVSVADSKATFQSDEVGGGPKFRLNYELKSGGELAIEFAIAPPGKPFQTYVAGTVTRK